MSKAGSTCSSKKSAPAYRHYSTRNTKCLFCLTTTSEDEPQLFSENEVLGATRCVLLQKQLQNFFVVRKILELPFYWCEKYLPRIGARGKLEAEFIGENEVDGEDPGFHFDMCVDCFQLVEDCWRLHQKILSLQDMMEEAKEKLKKKIVTSFEQSKNEFALRDTLTKEVRNYYLGSIGMLEIKEGKNAKLLLSSISPAFFQNRNDAAPDALVVADNIFVDDYAQDLDFDSGPGETGWKPPKKRGKKKVIKQERKYRKRKVDKQGASDEDLTTGFDDIDNFNIEDEDYGEDMMKQFAAGDPDFNIDYEVNDELSQEAREKLAVKKLAKKIRNRARAKGLLPKPRYIKKTIRCGTCKSRFRTQAEYGEHKDLHERNKLNNREFECAFCRFPCLSAEELNKHKSTRHRNAQVNQQIAPYKCKDCNFRTHIYYRLELHVTKNHTDPLKVDGKLLVSSFECDVCHQKLACASAYTRHRMQMHPEMFGDQCEQLLECNECHQRFGNEFEHAQHMKMHERKQARSLDFTCEVCGKGFHQKSKLKTHMITHGEKTWMCSICGIDYIHKNTLGNHYLRHHPGMLPFAQSMKATKPGETEMPKAVKQFTCPKCNKQMPAFFRRRHMKQHVLDEGNGFKCDQCDRVYTKLQALNKHIQINHNEGAQESRCPFCFKAFIHPEYVTAHYKYCKIKIRMDETGESQSHPLPIKVISQKIEVDPEPPNVEEAGDNLIETTQPVMFIEMKADGSIGRVSNYKK